MIKAYINLVKEKIEDRNKCKRKNKKNHPHMCFLTPRLFQFPPCRSQPLILSSSITIKHSQCKFIPTLTHTHILVHVLIFVPVIFFFSLSPTTPHKTQVWFLFSRFFFFYFFVNSPLNKKIKIIPLHTIVHIIFFSYMCNVHICIYFLHSFSFFFFFYIFHFLHSLR